MNTMAQEFVKFTKKGWEAHKATRLRVTMFQHPLKLAWTRQILQHYKEDLEEAGILWGVYAGLFEYRVSWALLKAFFTFCNSDGHTIVTRMGEIGFSLLDMREIRGLPITGSPYDEYIPEGRDFSHHLLSLYISYGELFALCSGSVSFVSWIDYLVEEAVIDPKSSSLALPCKLHQLLGHGVFDGSYANPIDQRPLELAHRCQLRLPAQGIGHSVLLARLVF